MFLGNLLTSSLHCLSGDKLESALGPQDGADDDVGADRGRADVGAELDAVAVVVHAAHPDLGVIACGKGLQFAQLKL